MTSGTLEDSELAEILRELLTKGLQLPIYMAGVSANGSLMMGRYCQERVSVDFEVLVTHHRDGTFSLPIDFIAADGAGRGAHIVLSPNLFNEGIQCPKL